ncbi:hypothetical protein HJD18_14795 [Thermoleophilia bacterium SCSIO 60948]|nr:hypothetical protein HJD18_14795 [Thermoleophilia bacterium SCSIO 60948]
MVLRYRTELVLLGVVAGSAIAWLSPDDRLEIFLGICLFALLVWVTPSRRDLEPRRSEGGWYSTYFQSRLTPTWVRALVIGLEVALVLALITLWAILVL